jgi:hypothetical protein
MNSNLDEFQASHTVKLSFGLGNINSNLDEVQALRIMRLSLDL